MNRATTKPIPTIAMCDLLRNILFPAQALLTDEVFRKFFPRRVYGGNNYEINHPGWIVNWIVIVNSELDSFPWESNPQLLDSHENYPIHYWQSHYPIPY